MRCFYNRKKIEEADLEKINKNVGLYWVHCSETNIKELKLVSKKFNIPLKLLKNSLDRNESPRIDKFDDYYYVVFRAPVQDNEFIGTTPVGFIITEKGVITITIDKLDSIDNFHNEQELKALMQTDSISIFIRQLLAMTMMYSEFLENVGMSVDEIEEKAFKKNSGDITEDIFHARKILLYLKKAFSENIKVIEALKKEQTKNKLRANLLDEAYIEMKQLIDVEEIYRGRIISIIEIFKSNISNRLNEVMKQFTVITALLLLPAVISGMYGMNLILPLQQNRYAFWIVLVIMLIGMLIMYRFFKARKWV